MASVSAREAPFSPSSRAIQLPYTVNNESLTSVEGF